MRPAALKIKEWRENPALFVKEVFSIKPDRWQEEALQYLSGNQFNPSRRIVMKSCTGAGKLFKDDTPIPTPHGWKNHGDLKKGDLVFAEDGSVTKIIATKRWNNIELFKITFSDGSVTICGAEHLWKVQSRFYSEFKDWNIAETQEIFKLRYCYHRNNGKKIRRFRIPIQGAIKLPKRELPVDPYVLGLWLGDGCRNTAHVVKNDEEIIHEACRRNYKFKKQKRIKEYAQRWTILGLKEGLKALGLIHLYSGERFIPNEYLMASEEQRKDLLMGLMDTDGSAKQNGGLSFHSTSKRLIDDVTSLARSLGCFVQTDRTSDNRKKSVCYEIRINSPFNPFKIRRKASRWKKPPDHKLYRYIDKIEKIGKESGQCIEIAHPSHCYLANDYLVTHNSSLLSWVAWHRLLCFAEKGEHPKGAAISGEGSDNLRDNLWAELSKWQERSPLLKETFIWTAERVYAKGFKETWFLSARSYAKDANAEAIGRSLSGLHSKFPFILLDEIGDAPVSLSQKAEQIFTGGVTDALIASAGNPTSTTGLLYQLSTQERERWKVITITADPDDPKRTPRVDIEHAREQIRIYGRDNPWVKATILGEFPDVGFNSLLSVKEVEDAMRRRVPREAYEFSQKRLGVDVARFGSDATCLFPRQGRVAFQFVEMRGATTDQIAARVMMAKEKWKSELELVDGSGGYGAGVVDFLRQSGGSPLEVSFSGKPTDARYFNKRSEMWFLMAEWIKNGGSLPDDPILLKELTSPTYTIQNGRFRLEEKEQIKKRLGFSTDRSDALALTFALPDAPSMEGQLMVQMPGQKRLRSDFDPYA